MSVNEMLHRVSAEEMVSWMAYDMIEPFGESRADFRSALSTAQILASKGAKNVTPQKLMVKFDKEYLNPPDWRTAMAEFKKRTT
jgi:hypothetical protein